MNMVHSIETTPLKHILKQINQKFGITQEEIEELSSDNSMGSLAYLKTVCSRLKNQQQLLTNLDTWILKNVSKIEKNIFIQ